MKIFWFIALFAFAVAAAVFLAGQFGILRGRAPKDLGVTDGRLKRPSFNPNSVSSQANLFPDHPQREYAQIDPIAFTGDADKAISKLANLMGAFKNTQVMKQESDYIYAQCSTPTLKFTDDVEFMLDRASSVIHVRSASRLGRKDFNANRNRVEMIRAQFLTN
jgi:uncharacterized protein (DUF1499 family)